MLGHRNLQRVAEGGFRTGAAIGEHASVAAEESIDQRCIESRLREIEVNELKHRVDVALRCAAGDSFAQIFDRWEDTDLLAGEEFLEVDDGELADAASRRDQVRRAGCHV